MATRQAQLPGPKSFDNDDDAEFIEGMKAEDISALQNDADIQLDKIFSESAAGQHTVEFKVKVYKVVPNKAESEWLFDCLPSDFPINQTLRDDYDGGKFDLRIFKREGAGGWKLYRRLDMSIAPISQYQRMKQAAHQTNPQTDQLAQVVAMLQQNQAAMLQFMKEQNKPAVAVAGPSMIEMMTAMGSFMGNMRGLMPEPARGSDPEKMFDIFARGIEVGKEASGNSDEPSMMGVLSEMVKSIGTAAAARPQPIAPVIQQPPALTAPQPASDPAMMEKMILKAQLANMCKKAAQHEKDANQGDPGLYADFVIDNVPEETLRRWAFNPMIMQEFAAMVPDVSQHPAWFGKVLTAITDYLTIPENEGDDVGHADGDPDDNTGHHDT